MAAAAAPMMTDPTTKLPSFVVDHVAKLVSASLPVDRARTLTAAGMNAMAANQATHAMYAITETNPVQEEMKPQTGWMMRLTKT
jgi:hypothetical protein